MLEAQLKEIVLSKFQEEGFEDYFLLDIHIFGKKLEIIIDSDQGVLVDKCQKISRALESFLDENEQIENEYVLEVTSPGITRPLELPRQYIKNIGRNISIELINQESIVEGKIITADQSKIIIEFLTIRKEGKKNIKEVVQQQIAYDEMNKAVIKISF